MRQQSLIILLAHAGLPVPAEKAFIPLVDGIFARIGSGDMLAKQQSTFMTEMVETATILHHATDRSFIIIDELGRGTGTRDGVALAKAISVYICQQIKAKTLFATHYHQLIDLEGVLDGAENVHVGVYESDHDIVFLKKIMPGGTQKSYGIDVAKYAGIPRGIIVLATQYCDEGVLSQEYTKKNLPSPQQSSLFQSSPKDLFVEQLRTSYAGLEVNKITPLEAMMILEKIVSSIRESANL